MYGSPAGLPMVSQAQRFVHLVAAASDGSHQPQVFRMRWDQPLRKLISAYGCFKGLDAEALKNLRVSAAGHSRLDPGVPPGVYGLRDFDHVTFTLPAELDVAPSAASLPATSLHRSEVDESGHGHDQEACGADVEAYPATPGESQAPPDAAVQNQEAESQQIDGDRHRISARKSMELVPEDLDVAGQGWLRPPAKGEARCGMLRDPRAGLRARARAARATEEAARSAPDAGEGARNPGYVRGRGRGRGGVRAVPMPRTHPVRDSEGCTAAVAVIAGEPVAEAATQTSHTGDLRRTSAQAWADCAAEQTGVTGVQSGDMRTALVKVGPATGWRVTAWLQDISHRQQGVTHANAIRWRILSPGRSRGFNAFRSNNGRNLREAAGEGVYTQIYYMVRPTLLRRIRKRRQVIERQKILAQKRARPMPAVAPITGGDEATPVGWDAPAVEAVVSRRVSVPSGGICGAGSRRSEALVADEGRGPAVTPSARRRLNTTPPGMAGETPARTAAPPSRSLTAAGGETAGVGAVGKQNRLCRIEGDGVWRCSCEAHLYRHPRCTPSDERLQPPLLHLLQDYLVVGRSGSCDIILNSRRTPQMVSRCHAVIHREEGVFSITDQGSMNGIWVNGERTSGSKALGNGDVVTFGIPTKAPELDYIFKVRRHV